MKKQTRRNSGEKKQTALNYFCNGLCLWKHTDMPCCAQLLNCVQLFEILWTVAHQDILSLELFRQEYCSGLPFPTPADLSNPGVEAVSLRSPALSGRFFTTVPPGKPHAMSFTMLQTSITVLQALCLPDLFP